LRRPVELLRNDPVEVEIFLRGWRCGHQFLLGDILSDAKPVPCADIDCLSRDPG
jgi:hypothetical protein